ncbi:MAG: hypothetical protein OXQ96_01700 [Alphaproteobacteria bacterium]|nr:hypothetical protein [Alphaproteobacteria bacterium]
MLRFLSAFLFALTLLAIGVGGFWFYAVNQAEVRLVNTVSEMLGARLSYQSVQRHYVLGRIQMTLKGAVLEGKELRYRLGDVDFESDFLGRYKLGMKFPKEQTLEILNRGKVAKIYQIHMENGGIQFFPSTNEVVFSHLTVLVQDNGVEILRTGIVDMTAQFEDVHVLNASVTLKKVVSSLFKGNDLDVPSLLFKGRIINFSNDWLDSLTTVLRSRDQDVLIERLGTIFEDIQRKQAYVEIEDLIYSREDDSFSMQGQLGLDERVRPLGDIRILVSQPMLLRKILEQSHLLSTSDLVVNTELTRVLEREQQTPYSYRVRFANGSMIADSLNIGVISPLPDLLNSTDLDTINFEPVIEPSRLDVQ